MKAFLLRLTLGVGFGMGVGLAVVLLVQSPHRHAASLNSWQEIVVQFTPMATQLFLVGLLLASWRIHRASVNRYAQQIQQLKAKLADLEKTLPTDSHKIGRITLPAAVTPDPEQDEPTPFNEIRTNFPQGTERIKTHIAVDRRVTTKSRTEEVARMLSSMQQD